MLDGGRVGHRPTGRVGAASGAALSGLLPRAGDAVLIGPSAGPDFTEPRWLLVSEVRPSNEPGWVYLHGQDDDADAQLGAERTVFVRVEGLVIRRGQVPA